MKNNESKGDLFKVDLESKSAEGVLQKSLREMGMKEEGDFQEWVINNPDILGEELLVIANEYSKFVDIRKRPDILALDSDGKLVVIELKRDTADETTDLQAIEYAGYCSVLTSEEVQKDYREFKKNNGTELSPEDVREKFGEHLGENFEEDERVTEGGWADFELDNKPRILLAAGAFPAEVTSPVMWLREEYGLDITCVTVHAYQHEGELLLNTRQMIPPPEAEEYMAQRQAKKRKQEESGRRRSTFKVLMDREILREGDKIEFNRKKCPPKEEWNVEVDDDSFWRAVVTGKKGKSDNFEWQYDGEEYSVSGMTQELLSKLTGNQQSQKQGPKFWCHPEFEDRTLLDLRNSGVDASGRETNGKSA